MPEAPTYQDVLEHLAKRAEENGDKFKITVLRRPNAASQLTQFVASFADATWSMIANAESWLGPFCGGGLYVIRVFDGADSRKQHGTICPSEIPGAPRAPDARVTRTSGWLGPTLIDSGPQAPAGAVALTGTFHTLAGEPQNGSPPRSATEAGLSGLFDEGRKIDAEYRRREAELAEERRKIEAASHRNELEALRRASEDARRAADDRIRALETRLAEPRAAPPGPDLGQIVTGILAAAAPIVSAFLAKSAQDRQEQIALERARIEREEKRAEEAAKRLETQLGRPLIDPQLLTLLEGQMKRAEESTAQFANFMKAQAESSRINLEAQATAQRSMLQTIADVAQLQIKTGDGEPPGVDWGKVALGVMQGLAAMQQRAGGAPGAPGAQGGTMIPPGQIAGAPQAAAPEPVKIPIVPSAALDVVEKLVKGKQPPSEVVEKLKTALSDEAAQKEIQACGGLIGVFDERLGEWSEDEKNGPYLEALQKELISSGVIPLSAFGGE